MPWKNHNGDISDLRPSRVRLANAETRTAEEVTDEILAEAGWYWAEPVVTIEITESPLDPLTLVGSQSEVILEPPVVEITANSSGSFGEPMNTTVPFNITI